MLANVNVQDLVQKLTIQNDFKTILMKTLSHKQKTREPDQHYQKYSQ